MLYVTLFVSAFAAVSDLSRRRVPNWLIVFGMSCQILALGFARVSDGSISLVEAKGAWLGLAVAATVFIPLWVFRAMGAGDVKFLMLVGFCAGLQALVWTWLIGSVAVAVFELGRVLMRSSAALAYVTQVLSSWFLGTAARAKVSEHVSAAPKTPAALPAGNRRGAPYVAFLALGLWCYLLWGARG